MDAITRNSLNTLFISELGLSYDEFEKLDYEEQRNLLEKNKKNKKMEYLGIMIGTGKDSIILKKKISVDHNLFDKNFIDINDKKDLFIKKLINKKN